MKFLDINLLLLFDIMKNYHNHVGSELFYLFLRNLIKLTYHFYQLHNNVM
jgi:hypothetical protein